MNVHVHRRQTENDKQNIDVVPHLQKNLCGRPCCTVWHNFSSVVKCFFSPNICFLTNLFVYTDKMGKMSSNSKTERSSSTDKLTTYLSEGTTDKPETFFPKDSDLTTDGYTCYNINEIITRPYDPDIIKRTVKKKSNFPNHAEGWPPLL